MVLYLQLLLVCASIMNMKMGKCSGLHFCSLAHDVSTSYFTFDASIGIEYLVHPHGVFYFSSHFLCHPPPTLFSPFWRLSVYQELVGSFPLQSMMILTFISCIFLSPLLSSQPATTIIFPASPQLLLCLLSVCSRFAQRCMRMPFSPPTPSASRATFFAYTQHILPFFIIFIITENCHFSAYVVVIFTGCLVVHCLSRCCAARFISCILPFPSSLRIFCNIFFSLQQSLLIAFLSPKKRFSPQDPGKKKTNEIVLTVSVLIPPASKQMPRKLKRTRNLSRKPHGYSQQKRQARCDRGTYLIYMIHKIDF